MAKYDQEFKLSIVSQYVRHEYGVKNLAKANGLPRSLVARWVAAYERHGEAGLRKGGLAYEYDAAFKMTVLQRMWDEGLSFNEVAALFNITGTTRVSVWERQYHSGGIEALGPRQRGRKKMTAKPTGKAPSRKRRTIGDPPQESLREENEHLKAEVAYLKELHALIQARPQPAPKKRS